MKWYDSINLPVPAYGNGQPPFVAKPDLSSFGFEPASTFLCTGENLDTEAHVAAHVASLTGPAPTIVFDIEGQTDIRVTPPADVTNRINFMLQRAAWAKAANPNVRVGFYGLPPFDTQALSYYTVAPVRSLFSPWWKGMKSQIDQAFTAWKAACDFLLPVYQASDIICPSLYATRITDIWDCGPNDYADNGVAWLPSAKLALAQAMGYHKPVVPFIAPMSRVELKYIPDQFWKDMVSFVKGSGADGCIVWYDKSFARETWSNDLRWFRDLTKIMNATA